RQLGLPEGTLSARLARGRAMLAKRLSRHGPTISTGTLAAVMTHNAASAGAPPIALVSSTIKVSSLVAAVEAGAAGLISAPVAALTEGVMKTMLLTKLKIVTTVLLVVAVSTAGGLLYQSQAGASAFGNRLPSADQASPWNTIATRFKHRVRFETGYTEFREGGRIEILEVRGTRAQIEEGGQYLVHGKYKLPPGQRGKIYFYETAIARPPEDPLHLPAVPWTGVSITLDLQTVTVDKESGDFTLMHGMSGPGYF